MNPPDAPTSPPAPMRPGDHPPEGRAAHAATPFDAWRPRALVFDCDGLLVDTEGCWTDAETALLAARGIAFAPGDRAALLGASVPRTCALLAQRLADGTHPEAVHAELVARVREIVARDARPMPGAVALVTAARACVPVAVASNSPRSLLVQALARAGLADAFDATVAADEVDRPKPAPDLYATACRRLGVAPADALALEDSATGTRAAAAAGLRTVAVPSLPGVAPEADVTVTSLADPMLVGWVSGWPRRTGPSPD